MTKEQILEVIQKLTGEILPVSDSTIDSERIENLKIYISIFEEMHDTVEAIVSEYWNSPFASSKQFAVLCRNSLDQFRK